MYTVTGYLTEGKLYGILAAWAGAENVKREVVVPGTRMKNDFEVLHLGITWVVEFDGDLHYRDPNVIHRDKVKDDISRKLGKVVIRIPYFVQLDTETFLAFFFPRGLQCDDIFEIETDFPHGYHTTKFLPSSYCPIGYGRLLFEFERFPESVRKAIRDSLEVKCSQLGEHLTYHINHIQTGEFDEDGDRVMISHAEFVRKSREVHGDRYEYPHPL